MRVDLIVILTGNTFESVEHLGVAYIKSYLMKQGIPCNIHIVYPDSVKDITNLFINESPLLIGFAMYAGNAQMILDAATLLKTQYPVVHINVGGPTTLNQAQNILQHCQYIDSITIGEGEITTFELAQHIQNKQNLESCRGLVFRNNNGVFITNEKRPPLEDLDELPFPDRSIYDKHRVTFSRIVGARGCLGHCTFCDGASKPICKNELRVRIRNPQNIIDEMEDIIHHYNISSFQFIDPTFEDPSSVGIQKAMGILDEINRRQLDVSYVVSTRSELVTEKNIEYLRKLRDTGLEFLYVGLESGNEQDLKLYGKKATLKDNWRAVRLLREENINIWFGFINFNPYTTYDRLLENATFLHDNMLGYLFWPFATRLEIYPAASIAQKMVQDKLVKGELNFLTGIHDYKFINPGIQELMECLETFNTTLNQGLIDQKLDILRAKIRKHNCHRYDDVFVSIDEKRHEDNEKNYYFIQECIAMSQSGKNQEEILNFSHHRAEECKKSFHFMENIYWKTLLSFERNYKSGV